MLLSQTIGICGLRHAKMSLRAYADSKRSDQSAHPCSLIRAFHCPLTDSLDTIECMENKGPEET